MATEIISRKDAIARGFVRYCVGQACKRGHFAERYVCNRACIICEKDRHANDRKKRRSPFQICVFNAMRAHIEHPREGYQNERLHCIGADVAAQLVLMGIRL